MSSGTGWRMISLNKSSPSSILLSHNTGWSGFVLVPPKLGLRRATSGLTRVFATLILIDQLGRWR